MDTIHLSRAQFEILACLERIGKPVEWSEMSRIAGVPSEMAEGAAEVLLEGGLIRGGAITEQGLAALEPYRARRAVLLAAGLGSRLAPVTQNTPKPLVRVNGVRMIDTLLNAVLAAGIEEIYVVRGYLGEQFDALLSDYPMLRFLENPHYREANNIASAMCARHLLRNAYVLEADLVLYNADLIRKYQYTSNYLGVPVEHTDDWCAETENGVITCLKVGGNHCHQIFGISYWNAEDGARLWGDLKAVYEQPGGRNCYWDQVPLEYCRNHYRVGLRACTFEDITEIDSYSDLCRVDRVFRGFQEEKI